jgi:HNH endonuclease
MPPRPRDVWTRILPRIIRLDTLLDPDRCWEWNGAHSLKRRGERRPVVQVGGRGTAVVPVARIMCELRNGPPPTPEHEAAHICPQGENHRCIRPDHLAWMTRVENERYKRKRTPL